MAIIWGVQRTARTGQEHMIEWAAALLQDLKSRQLRFAITAIVLGEYLAKFHGDELQVQLAAIQKNFIVLPFDARAAGLAAALWQKHGADKSAERPVLKADIQIVATAQAAGVTTIYSNDLTLKKIAAGILLTKSIEKPPADLLSGQP
jgi:predicted nucleic acid-binding protein